MKTILYYFTGTGNSLIVAKDLAKELGDTLLLPIAREIKKNEIRIPANTRVGLVFPVYIWGPPLIVLRFIAKLQAPQESRIFAVANYGGFPGGTLTVVNRALKQKGLSLEQGFGVKMPGNYTPMYGALSEPKQQKMFAREKATILKIVEQINQNRRGIYKNNPLINWFFTGLLYKYSAKYMPQMAKDFIADEKCDLCGICVKICPVDNIQIKNKTVKWDGGKCEQCFACLQWCPKTAIQFGKSTAKRRRYHHPQVSLKEMLALKSR